MKDLVELIHLIQNEDEQAMLEMINMFSPIIKKYDRYSKYDEDFHSEMILKIISIAHSIDLTRLKESNSFVIIRYINKAIRNLNISYSTNKKISSESVLSYDDIEIEIRDHYLGNQSEYDEILLDMFLKNILTEKEYICMYYLLFENFSISDIARKLNITRQSVHETKNRALSKIIANL